MRGYRPLRVAGVYTEAQVITCPLFSPCSKGCGFLGTRHEFVLLGAALFGNHLETIRRCRFHRLA